MKKKRIMISGYYGFGNIGDEAILTAIVDNIRKIDSTIDFVILSSNPELTSHELGVKAVNRWNPAIVLKELLSTDLLISGGGGLMQDVTGPANIIYYGGLLMMAQMLNVKTMIYAQGIGPLSKAYNKALVKTIFNKCKAITVRDIFSQNDLVSYGVKKEKIQVTADPVLLLSGNSKSNGNKILAELGIPEDAKVIGISIRPWNQWFERQLKAFTSVVYQLAKKYNLHILLIPFHYSTDLWLCQEAQATFASRPEADIRVTVLEKELNPKDMMDLISCMNLVIGMRLHSLIMAAANSIPSVGISYDPKVTNFASIAGFPCLPSVTELQNVELVLETIENVIMNLDSIKTELEQNLPRLKDLSMLNVNTAVETLNKR